jgi:hypothetical protein
VLLVTIDGLRWQEVFAGADASILEAGKDANGIPDSQLKSVRAEFWTESAEARRRKLMPFVWDTIARQGQLYGNRALGSAASVLNAEWISYPGYNEMASGVADPRGDAWRGACRKLGNAPLCVRGQWREGLSTGGAGGVQFAEGAVDTETGFVRVHKILAVQDCGTVVNRLTCESQINGGVIMGLGYALYEERILDRATGTIGRESTRRAQSFWLLLAS